VNNSSDPWDSIELGVESKKKIYESSDGKDPWSEVDFKESWGKSMLRSLYQIPSGLAKRFTFPLDLIHMIGVADASDPEEIDRLKIISEREGIPFDEEKYFAALNDASSMFPSQGNIESLVEEKTGAPLVPRNALQKSLRLGSEAYGFFPGTAIQKSASAVAAPAASQTLQRAFDVPEEIADMAGLLVSPAAGAKTPAVSIGKATKPSGMPVRRFESLKKPTEVSPGRAKTIAQKVEGDFKKIAEDLIKESPTGSASEKLKTDARFKEKVGESFREVERLAENIEGTVHSKEVKSSLINSAKKKESTGISPSEYEKDYNSFLKKHANEIKNKELSAKQIVEQFRKNNKALSDQYDPSKSRSHNRAKKDALIEYNRNLADLVEKKYPGTELSEPFKASNKRWTEIKDAEMLDKFVDDLFTGKVNYEKGNKFFTPGYQDAFKRALGDKYSEFSTLMNDLMGTKEAFSRLKVAESKGYSELGKTFMHYLIHPKLAAAKVGYNAVKSTYKSLLDKPKLTITWDEGVKAFKKGDFKKAEQKFSILDKELTTKQKAYQQFKNRPKNSVD